MLAHKFNKVAFVQHLKTPYVLGTLAGAGLGGAEAAYKGENIGKGALTGGGVGLAATGLVRGANRFLGSSFAKKTMEDAKNMAATASQS